MPTPKLTRDILLAALTGFQLDKQRIDAQIAEVQAMLDGGGSAATSVSEEAPMKGTRRKFSAAARRHMREAQGRRWAAIKGTAEQPEPATPEAPTKEKRRLSAAARKAIGAATKKRWALQKAAEATKSAQAKETATRKVSAKRAKAILKKVAPVRKVAVKRSLRKNAQVPAPALAQGAGQ